MLRGEGAHTATIHDQVVASLGQVLHRQQVLAQLGWGRDETEVEREEDAVVERQSLVEPCELEAVIRASHLRHRAACGSEHFPFGSVERRGRDFGRSVQSLQDRVRHRELAQFVEMGAISQVHGVVFGRVLDVGVGLDDPLLDLAHRPLHVDGIAAE